MILRGKIVSFNRMDLNFKWPHNKLTFLADLFLLRKFAELWNAQFIFSQQKHFDLKYANPKKGLVALFLSLFSLKRCHIKNIIWVIRCNFYVLILFRIATGCEMNQSHCEVFTKSLSRNGKKNHGTLITIKCPVCWKPVKMLEKILKYHFKPFNFVLREKRCSKVTNKL